MIRFAVVVVGCAVVMLTAAAHVASNERLPVAAVVVGAVVSQPYGCTNLQLEPFDPLCPGLHVHTGIDLAAPLGTEVHSATAGTAFLGYDPAAGNFVVVVLDTHVRILYCHLSAFRVRPGESVTPGQVIGLVGATGLATGPHVHLQVNVDGSAVDPVVFLGP
ncbi:MAG TPA: M23 family metallopeptidase [Candidatus Dormibacteraeota bacterium]|nr:M23 family metallopeptidase [Candidatus Dormibacteraeota bacterium]HEX2680847.1 M23 family metallopeptidase [Candidatus Dormibacteraeota bacterium]